MVTTKKSQILVKRETSEGESSNPGSSNGVLVYEPTIADAVETLDRRPAGPSLSRSIRPIGRKERTVTFQSDFRGSGDTSIPVTTPEWGELIEAGGFRKVALTALPISGPTGAFAVGEIVGDGTARGVVVGAFVGGSTLAHRLAAAGDLIVWAFSGTFASLGTLTGESTGAVATLGTVAAYAGLGYVPSSQRLVQITTGAWTGTDPVDVGEVLLVLRSGERVGAVQLISDNGSTWVDINVTTLYGSLQNGDTIQSAAGGTAVLSAAPTQIQIPTDTIRHNMDGRRRDLLGARTAFQLDGDSGNPMTFSWTATGSLGTPIDALPVTTTGLSSIVPPRLFGAIAGFRVGANTVRPPIKHVGFDPGNQVVANLDANSAGGSTGSNINDRDPKLQIQTDQVHSAIDWETIRDAGTLISSFTLLGTAKGSIVGIVAPLCQVLGAQIGDADGTAVFDLELCPTRILESGDDEIILVQL